MGQVETARDMCGALFLEHAPVLSRDGALLGAYIECLLLLEMTALLPRVLQAAYGTTVDMVSVLAGEWRVSFGNGLVLMVALA